MRLALIGLALWLPSLSAAQAVDLQRLYEAGEYEEVVSNLETQSASPSDLYLGAQSQAKLGRSGEARTLFDQLVERGPRDAWHHIGQSAILLAEDNVDEALNQATQAVAVNDSVPEAHYQLGLVQGYRSDFAAGAASFDRASQLKPTFAYAYYHAGLSYYQDKRIDLMGARFETFLRAAPDAPERAEVESIMRTVRGR